MEPGRGLCWVRDDLQDVALQGQDKNSAPLHRDLVVTLLQQVEAVLREAKRNGRPPLTTIERRSSPAREKTCRRWLSQTYSSLVPTHSYLICIVEQP